MARITTAVDCVLSAVFVLKNRSLGQQEYVIFRTCLATKAGAVNIDHSMLADELSAEGDTRVTLEYNLDGLEVVPGVYEWELLLQESNGAFVCLLPAKNNALCICDRLTYPGGDGS